MSNNPPVSRALKVRPQRREGRIARRSARDGREPAGLPGQDADRGAAGTTQVDTGDKGGSTAAADAAATDQCLRALLRVIACTTSAHE